MAHWQRSPLQYVWQHWAEWAPVLTRSPAELTYLRIGSGYPKFQGWLRALRFNGKSLCWLILFIQTLIADNCSYWMHPNGSVIWFSHSQLESFTFRLLTLCKAGSVLLLSLVSHLWTYRSIFIYYFIFGCAGLSLLCGLSLVTGGLISSCGVWASHCGGFSCCGTRAVGIQAPGVAAFGLSSSGYPALEHRFNCCGTWAWFLWGIQDLPGPGIELMSPGLAGGFFPTESPGEPRTKPLYTLPHVSTGKNFDALRITGPLDPPQWLLSRCQWYQQGCIQSPGWFLEEIQKHQAPEF